MSYEITGNRHMGACMKKKQAYLNEWKLKARRKIMPGFPVEEPFKTRQEVDNYLNVDRLICLLCGKTYKSLCAHLAVHGTNADDYKEKYGLPLGCGLSCESTKDLLVKHGKKLVSEGIFRPPTPEEHKVFMATKRKYRKKPAYAIDEAAARIQNRQPEKTFHDHHYWKVLEIAERENIHPTDACRKNKKLVPSVGVMHVYKRNNEDFKNKYDEIIANLPLHIQLKHGIAPEYYIDQMRELKKQGNSHLEISQIMGIHENTIDKQVKKNAIKNPPKTTCGNGLHHYPGLNKPCNLCATERTRKKNGYMERSISKTIIIDRNCTKCNAEIQVSRLYGNRKTAYCEPCKKEKYYESQDKYRREKRPLLKNINKD